ncbi:MAG: MBL fold metallo-hydrolase [Planctomycetales bacterium]
MDYTLGVGDTIAECYFLDVGQGSAQVIDLGDDSAIVIDCGRSYVVLGDLLHRWLRIRRIEALILSHNDVDHVGGVAGLVRQYRRAIDRVYFLQDRNAGELADLQAMSFLRREAESGNIPDPIPLIRNPQNLLLYEGGDGPDALRLDLLFPGVFENISGQSSGDPNATCAVLLLRCGSRRILFSGDADIRAWRSIHSGRTGPIECDVIAVPHHGGQIVRHKATGEEYEELHEAIAADLRWLYGTAIQSRIAVISVGTSNPYPDPHPLPPQVAAINAAGSCVMCTQITSRCSSRLPNIRNSILTPQELPGRSRVRQKQGNGGQARDIGCAGTILVQLGPNSIQVARQQDHQNAIDRVLTAPTDHPLCRQRNRPADEE